MKLLHYIEVHIAYRCIIPIEIDCICATFCVYVFVASIRITFNALSFGKIGDRDMFINHPLSIFNGRDVCIIQTYT